MRPPPGADDLSMRSKRAFTLIEMIGAIAVIALLSAMLAPKIYQILSDSKSAKSAAQVKIFELAIASWHKDFGTLNLIDSDCSRRASALTFEMNRYLTGSIAIKCPKFKGPYLDKIPASPIGSRIVIYSVFNATSTISRDNAAFDLNGDGRVENAYRRTVFARHYDVESRESLEVDAIIDDDLIARENRELSGRVKCCGPERLLDIYIAHR